MWLLFKFLFQNVYKLDKPDLRPELQCVTRVNRPPTAGVILKGTVAIVDLCLLRQLTACPWVHADVINRNHAPHIAGSDALEGDEVRKVRNYGDLVIEL